VARKKFDIVDFAKTYMIIGVLILFVLALAILTEGNSIAPVNLVNVIRQVSAIGIIGVGMTFVIITLGIDLSVGSILGLSAVVAASLAQNPGGDLVKFEGVDVPVIVAVLAGLGVGALAGFTNGVLIAKFRLAPFIATLGMMSIARGLAYIYTGDGRPFSDLKDDYNFLGQGYLFSDPNERLSGIPLPVVLFIAVALIATFILSYTKFGRYTYAIGGNEVEPESVVDVGGVTGAFGRNVNQQRASDNFDRNHSHPRVLPRVVCRAVETKERDEDKNNAQSA
jgi:inositol transport system permease protein